MCALQYVFFCTLIVLVPLMVVLLSRSVQDTQPVMFVSSPNVSVDWDFIPLAGEKNHYFQTTPDGHLVARRGGVYSVTLWVACSIMPGGLGSDATLQLTLADNAWVHTLHRYHGGACYTNFAVVGTVKVRKGQRVCLQAQQIDGIATACVDRTHVLIGWSGCDGQVAVA